MKLTPSWEPNDNCTEWHFSFDTTLFVLILDVNVFLHVVHRFDVDVGHNFIETNFANLPGEIRQLRLEVIPQVDCVNLKHKQGDAPAKHLSTKYSSSSVDCSV